MSKVRLVKRKPVERLFFGIEIVEGGVVARAITAIAHYHGGGIGAAYRFAIRHAAGHVFTFKVPDGDGDNDEGERVFQQVEYTNHPETPVQVEELRQRIARTLGVMPDTVTNRRVVECAVLWTAQDVVGGNRG